MRNEKVTISDIAEVLGISPVSISRALSGQPGVSRELKAKILEKAREMGYVKNKKINQLSILVLHLKPYMQDNSNFNLMLHGVEHALQKADADYHAEFVDKRSHEQLNLPYKLSRGAEFDGVILLGRFSLEYAAFIKEKIHNLIYFTGYSPAYDYDSVWFSFMNAGYKQCEYLIKKGHKNIGFIGHSKIYRNKEKILGITSAFEDYNLPFNKSYFIASEESYEEKLNDLIEGNDLPTAFICEHDFNAVELIKFLYGKNIKVPQDVSVVSSGNTEMSTLSIPALTTMDLNIQYASEAVVSTLLKRIENRDKPAENIAVLSTLIERDSVRSL